VDENKRLKYCSPYGPYSIRESFDNGVPKKSLQQRKNGEQIPVSFDNEVVYLTSSVLSDYKVLKDLKAGF
jgi:hypothetical protein